MRWSWSKKPFLKWLKPGKPTYCWGDIKERIFKLSSKIQSLIKEGDRCLILSENRPYWLISDIAVMNAGGISVPIFTTYAKKDYEYILKDCNPSLAIISNINQFEKIKSLNQTIIKDFGIKKPKFIIAGINPHCGENGVISQEDNILLKPIINNLRKLKINVDGPISPDAIVNKKFDIWSENFLKSYNE